MDAEPRSSRSKGPGLSPEQTERTRELKSETLLNQSPDSEDQQLARTDGRDTVPAPDYSSISIYGESHSSMNIPVGRTNDEAESGMPTYT